MSRLLVVFGLALSTAFAQYKAVPAGAPASDIPGPLAGGLQKDGFKVQSADGKDLFEIWFRGDVQKTAPNSEENVSINTVPHGALFGVIRFDQPGKDRRGQNLKPGVYTLRYSMFPITGDHQGVAPQRDFLLLTPAADDADPTATPNYSTLTKASMKASGTPHPAVLSLSKDDGSTPAGLTKDGDTDWTLHSKVGDIPVALIVIGTFGS
jgi:hypothetical protein